MAELALKKNDGGTMELSAGDLEALRKQVRGRTLVAGDAGYDEARTVWNATVDRRPALIVRPASAEDIAFVVRYAAERGALLSIRGGGHHIAGNAVCEGGLMLDLSSMRAVSVDPQRRTARVEPGANLADVDAATQAHGLAVPLGINSTTGVAGLTLGGGFGWLSRKLGLTIDNLAGVDMVTADGKRVRASEQDDADLFWAVRGGSGNFGVATAFDFKLHPVGPEVLSGLVVHRWENAAELLAGYRAFVATAPEELTCWVVLRRAPPLPFLPAEVHGTNVLIFAACYAGDMERGREAVAPLRKLGKPIADVIAPHPFAAWQQAFDPLLTPGARNYWKSHDFKQLSGASDEVLIRAASTLPGPECEMFVAHMGGAVNRVPVDATAYPHRDVQFVVNVHTRWREPSQDAAYIAWARRTFDELAPHATGGVYVNFMSADEAQRVQTGAYGSNHARLARLKARYDPANFFRMNQNIRPAA